MLEAKSMYRGGEIVSALDIESYEQPKQLGLICPFCSEALFLNSGGVRKRGNKMQFINPHFSHYRGGTDSQECEKRSHSLEGRERIKQLRGEARNQRLKLYNMYLWEMASCDRNISSKQLGRISSAYGRKLVEQAAINLHREWYKYQSDLYTAIHAAVLEIKNFDYGKVFPGLTNLSKITRGEGEGQKEYFNGIDKKLHLAICYEIVDFFSTKSAGYAFQKMFIASLKLVETAVYPRKINLRDSEENHAIMFAIAGFIAGTHWIEQIEKHLSI